MTSTWPWLTIWRAAKTVADGRKLPGTPDALAQVVRGDDVPLSTYLSLTDDVLHVAMRAWEDGEDTALAELCRRIRCRALHKTLELFGDQASVEGRTACLELARKAARARGLDPDTSVGLDVAEVVPFASAGEPLMVVYAKGPARPLKEVSFLLGRLANEVLARVRLVVAPELRDEVVRAVGY